MKKILVEEGSDNIFADIGVSNPEESLLKAKLVVTINKILTRQNLTQVDSAKLLGLTQNKISDLRRGKLKGFSVEKLFSLLTMLHMDVDIRIKRVPKKHAQGQIHLMAA